MSTEPWFFAHALSVDYPDRSAGGLFGTAPTRRAVHDVALTLRRGEILALVGESGCGKSSLGRALAQLTRPSAGVVQLDGVALSDLWARRWGHRALEARRLRRRVQMIFQDSWASLDPTQTIHQAIAEPLRIHKLCAPAQEPSAVAALLAEVGLDASVAQRWPHALSGGQRQRANIARALAAQPDIIIADEPTSALDVSVKGHVLFMFERVAFARNLGLIFISHDLAAVRAISHRVSVMVAGRIVESGPTQTVLHQPKHPYTQALLEAAPLTDPVLQRARLHGASTIAAPPGVAQTGCPYRLVCPRRIERCEHMMPALITTDEDQAHSVACHRAHTDDQTAPSMQPEPQSFSS